MNQFNWFSVTLWQQLVGWIDENKWGVDCRYLANIAAVQHIILFTDIIFYWHHVK